jgi:hypothetical protein
VQLAQQRSLQRVERQSACRLAGVEMLVHAFQHVAQARRVLVAGFCILLRAPQAALDGIEVRQRQLGVDDLDVGDRIDLASDVHDVVVDEATHHVCDRVGFAYVRQELVAEAFTL